MANPRPDNKVTQNGKARLNLRIPADLDAWVRKYCKANNTTITQILISHLTELRKRAEEGHVEQF